MKYHFIVHNI